MTVFLLDRLEKLSEKDLASFYPKLSLQRREKVDSLRFLPDKTASACAYLLLRLLLKKEREIIDAPEFGFLEEKKPFILGREDIFFSLSHDRAGVGVALSDKPVGIDVQAVFHYEEMLAERILSEKERAVFDPNKPDEELFTQFWTMKESLGKKGGEGVMPHLKSTDFSGVKGGGVYRYGGDVFTVGKSGEVFYSVCASSAAEIKVLSSEEFFKEVALLTDAHI